MPVINNIGGTNLPLLTILDPNSISIQSAVNSPLKRQYKICSNPGKSKFTIVNKSQYWKDFLDACGCLPIDIEENNSKTIRSFLHSYQKQTISAYCMIKIYQNVGYSWSVPNFGYCRSLRFFLFRRSLHKKYKQLMQQNCTELSCNANSQQFLDQVDQQARNTIQNVGIITAGIIQQLLLQLKDALVKEFGIENTVKGLILGSGILNHKNHLIKSIIGPENYVLNGFMHYIKTTDRQNKSEQSKYHQANLQQDYTSCHATTPPSQKMALVDEYIRRRYMITGYNLSTLNDNIIYS